MGLLYDANPHTRSVVVAHDVGDELVLDHRQDVEPNVDWNREIRNQHDGRIHGNQTLAMSIPPVIYADLMRRGIAGDPDAFKKWMRSAEADPWRIHPSRNLV